MNRLLLPALCLALAAESCCAQELIVLDQVRQLTISTTADGFTSTASAPNQDPFTATLSHSIPFSVNGVNGTNSGIGFISCHFENGIKGRARLRAQGGTIPGAPAIQGLATSAADVLFRLDTGSPFYVLIRGNGIAQTALEQTLVRLSEVSTGRVLLDADHPSLDGDSTVAGDLTPGTYRFEYLAHMTASGDQCDRDLRFEFALGHPPCSADFNEDGGVDGADVEAFFTAWEDADRNADINNDGGIDGSDVEAFFDLWEAGGC